ncbi:MAG: hypothetical protein GDA48_07160 [Hormoscilla sp. GM102CHS1]|nr:hypothetical protein [Hormoscilla sp. GM102CHS1]
MSGAPVVDATGKAIAVHGLTKVEQFTVASDPNSADIPNSTDSSNLVEVNTFKWGIPINTYLNHQPAIIVETSDYNPW